MVTNSQRLETVGFRGMGAVFLALAVCFGWHEAGIDITHALAPIGVIFTLMSVMRRPRALPFVGFVGVTACLVVGACWYAFLHHASLVPGVGISLLGVMIAAPFAYKSLRDNAATLSAHGVIALKRYVAISLACAVTLASWVFYFQFLTLGDTDTGRRLVLTIFWLVAGIAFVVLGARKHEAPFREAGLIPLAFAVVKAFAYDLAHLNGISRVAVLAVPGVLLLAASALIPRRTPEGA